MDPVTTVKPEVTEAEGEKSPFVSLSFIPGNTPLNKFQERALRFVQSLGREELELLGCLCYLRRGELATPQELEAASAITGVPVAEEPMTYREIVDREG